MACVNSKDLMRKDRVLACFKSFDIDGSNSISLSEIKNTRGKLVRLRTESWNMLMKHDEDGNCEMDLDEFSAMLEDIFKGNLEEM